MTVIDYKAVFLSFREFFFFQVVGSAYCLVKHFSFSLCVCVYVCVWGGLSCTSLERIIRSSVCEHTLQLEQRGHVCLCWPPTELLTTCRCPLSSIRKITVQKPNVSHFWSGCQVKIGGFTS